MLPRPPVVVPVAALDLVGGGGRPPAEAVGEAIATWRRNLACGAVTAIRMHGRAEATWDRDAAVDQDAVDGLVRLLDLEPIEVNLFRGVSPPVEQPAGLRRPGRRPGARRRRPHRRADDGTVHSLHAYFLRPGDPTVPILYEVDRIRDGRSFTTRRVVAIQHGKADLQPVGVVPRGTSRASTTRRPMPDDVAAARVAADLQGALGRQGRAARRVVRPAPPDRHPPRRRRAPTDRTQPARRPRQQVWLRAAGRLPDDPILHTCVLTYASDMTLLDTAAAPPRRRVRRATS